MPDPRTAPFTVLVADDDPVALELLASTLAERCPDVRRAADGEEAWAQIASGEIGMVLADWRMPRLDGVDLCRRIREARLPHYVYCIIVTAHSATDQVVAALDAGADDFLAKPFEPAELAVRVRAGMRVLELERKLDERIDALRTAVRFLRDQSSIIDAQREIIDAVEHGAAQVPISWTQKNQLVLDDRRKTDLEQLMRQVEQDGVVFVLQR